MVIKAGFESPEDKLWHDKRQVLEESFFPLGFSKETINSALVRFEPFFKNYCCRRIEIPEVDERTLRQINAQVHELTSEMLLDIARLCMELEL